MTIHDHASPDTGPQRMTRRIVFWVFIAAAAFYLISEHRAHLLGALVYLPLLLLLACPFMHFGMHGGHGHSHSSAPSNPEQPTDDSKSAGHHHHGGTP
jgi:hypothetical protein